MDTTKKSPVILSLCTGLLRGLEIGIEHALRTRLTIAAYAEIEAFIVENLLCGMEKGVLDPAPVWTDLKTFPFSEFRGKVHGIIGGYPCQPFSVAGNQKGVDDPRHLWPYIKEGIAAVKPIFCFFENVRGHLNLGYEEVRGELQGLGYEVREGIYSAEEVGAPHRRDRLFILAIRRDQLADTNDSGSRQNIEHSELWAERAFEPSCNSRGSKPTESNERGLNSFPSRPGEYQFEWEEKRVIESGICKSIDGNKDRVNYVYLNKKYEIYSAEKFRSIEDLHNLWLYINQESHQWSFGRLFGFLEEKILFSTVLCKIKNPRFSNHIVNSTKVLSFKEIELRNVWNDTIAKHPSQRQKSFEQLRIEFTDVMCVLSYEASLARGQEREAFKSINTVQCLWEKYKDSCWDVPETLSKIKEIWKPYDNQDSERQFMDACAIFGLNMYQTIDGYNFREDLLRGSGNGVVWQTASFAFTDLLSRF